MKGINMNKSIEELGEERNRIIGFDPENEELCLEAVRQDVYALQYVKEQTEEICLEAVRQDNYALKFVKDQTPEICLEAVRQNCYALKFVKDLSMLV